MSSTGPEVSLVLCCESTEDCFGLKRPLGPVLLRKTRSNRKQAGQGGGEGGQGRRLCLETQSLHQQRYRPHPHINFR